MAGVKGKSGRTPVPVLTRIWSHIHRRPDGCWEWTGAIKDGTTGAICVIRDGDKAINVRRVLYAAEYGEVPRSLNPCTALGRTCVNPAHAVVRDRVRTGPRVCDECGALEEAGATFYGKKRTCADCGNAAYRARLATDAAFRARRAGYKRASRTRKPDKPRPPRPRTTPKAEPVPAAPEPPAVSFGGVMTLRERLKAKRAAEAHHDITP